MDDKDAKRMERIKALLDVTRVPSWHPSGSTTEQCPWGSNDNMLQLLDFVEAVPWLIELLEEQATQGRNVYDPRAKGGIGYDGGPGPGPGE